MSRRFALVLCLFLSSAAFAGGFSKSQDFRAATPEELAMTSLPSAPGSAAAVLDWVEVDDDNTSSSTEYVRVKIFTDEGKKYGDVEIPYVPTYPVYGRIGDIAARTIRPDGTVVPFNGKVYDKIIYKAGGRALRAKTFSLADVQPGSILEYRYQRRWAENMLFDTLWILQRDIPVAHLKLSLKPYSATYSNDFSTFFIYVGLPQGKKPEQASGGYELELANMAPVPHEPFSPPDEAMTAHVKFYYTRSRVEPAKFWDSETAVQRKQIEAFLGKSQSARTMGQQLTAGVQDPLEKLKRLYAKAQSMRNYSFESEKSNQEVKKEDITESRGVDEVLRKQAGFRDEINRLFVAMARGAGLPADVVRVAARDTSFFSREIPDAQQVSGEMAVVTLDGKPLYLDPGTPHAPFGTVSWEKTSVPAFQIARDDVKWIEIPGHPPAEALTKRTAALKLNGDTLEGTMTVTFHGQEALTRRVRNAGDDEAARRKAFEDEVKGWFADGATVKAVSFAGLSTFAEPLTATFEVSLPIASRAGSRVLVPLAVFSAAQANPLAAATRTNPLYFPYAYRVEDEVKLTMPDGLAVATAPPPAKVDAGPFKYDNEVNVNGSELTYRRALNIDALLIEKKYYNSVRNFFSAVTTADQKPLVLTQKAP
ncbi:MAG TPA: DUF3857 domain-containing protein [Thermoanaerobaculia bacterium]|nr:DUF3857 domain-containing protein [Thermoanaerobaculia bacterium]